MPHSKMIARFLLRLPPLLKLNLEEKDSDSFLNNFFSLLIQFSSVAQSCPILCDPVNCSTPGLPVILIRTTLF